MRQPSEQLLALLKTREELNLYPYDDDTGEAIHSWCKGATIGYGHLIPLGEWQKLKNGITKDEAEILFIQDIAPAAACVGNNVHICLTQNKLDALVMLGFNIGCGAFQRSSALKMINGQPGSNYPTLELAWKAFNNGGNKGLINRRNCEWNIWTNNIYKGW